MKLQKLKIFWIRIRLRPDINLKKNPDPVPAGSLIVDPVDH